jgi:hypothetical protein
VASGDPNPALNQLRQEQSIPESRCIKATAECWSSARLAIEIESVRKVAAPFQSSVARCKQRGVRSPRFCRRDSPFLPPLHFFDDIFLVKIKEFPCYALKVGFNLQKHCCSFEQSMSNVTDRDGHVDRDEI